jgi:hypothetical protein
MRRFVEIAIHHPRLAQLNLVAGERRERARTKALFRIIEQFGIGGDVITSASP